MNDPSRDPRRHIRVRLAAAQLLVHHVLPALPTDLDDRATVLLEAIEGLGASEVTFGEVLSEVLNLAAAHANTREAMVRTLRSEIAEQRLYLENV